MSAVESSAEDLARSVVLLHGSGMSPVTVAEQLGITPSEVRTIWRDTLDRYGLDVHVAEALQRVILQLHDVQEQQALIASAARAAGDTRTALTALRDRAATLRTEAAILRPPEGTNVFVSTGSGEGDATLREWIAQTTKRRAAAVDVLEADS